MDVEAGSISSTSTLDGITVTNGNAIQVGATSTATLLLEDHTAIIGGALTINSSSTLDIEAGSGKGTFTTVDDPAGGATGLGAVNDAGELIGTSAASAFPFTDNNGAFATITQPSWSSAIAFGINDAGQIVGIYYTSGNGQTGGVANGFLDNGGTFTTIDDPSSTLETYANGINNAGGIVGFYTTGSIEHGFLYSAGVWTTLDDPASNHNTQLQAINDLGQIVGQYYNNDGSSHGLLYSDGTWTTVDDPSGHNTAINGINDAGQIVGYYLDSNNVPHGFLYSGGDFITIDDPLGVDGTVLTGINNAGEIVGSYWDASGVEHGFTLQYSSATLDGVSVANTGANIDVGVTSAATLLIDGNSSITGGELTIGAAGVLNSAGTTSFTGVDITNNGTLEVASGTLTIDGTTINGGTINDFSSTTGGNIDVTGASEIAGTNLAAADLNGNGAGTVTLDAGLTLDYVKLAGITIKTTARCCRPCRRSPSTTRSRWPAR